MGGLLTKEPRHGQCHQQRPKYGDVWQVYGACEQSAGDEVGEMDWHLILENLEHEAEEFGFGLVSQGEPLSVLGKGRV